jgi:hypothetical protein
MYRRVVNGHDKIAAVAAETELLFPTDFTAEPRPYLAIMPQKIILRKMRIQGYEGPLSFMEVYAKVFGALPTTHSSRVRTLPDCLHLSGCVLSVKLDSAVLAEELVTASDTLKSLLGNKDEYKVVPVLPLGTLSKDCSDSSEAFEAIAAICDDYGLDSQTFTLGEVSLLSSM